jgi:hypothetical protein
MKQQKKKAKKSVAVHSMFHSFLRQRRVHFLLLPLFLVMMVSLSVDSFRRESLTLDEPLHLTAGYTFWSFGDFRLQLSHGALPQRWYAIPLLFSKLEFPSLEDPSWRQPGYLGLKFPKVYAATKSYSASSRFREAPRGLRRKDSWLDEHHHPR